MQTGPTAAPGLMASLRTVAAGLVTGVHDRLELLAIEVQEEKFRLIQVFLWIGAVFLFAVMTLAFASLVVVYLFWESGRLAALCGLTGLYGAALIAVIVSFRRFLVRQPEPFAETLRELRVDQTCIRGQN